MPRSFDCEPQKARLSTQDDCKEKGETLPDYLPVAAADFARFVPPAVAESFGAVASAMEDTKVFGPGTDSFAVLVGQDAGELVEMGEIVGGPGGEQLRKGDGAEIRMLTAPIEIPCVEIQGGQFAEVYGAEAGELIERLRKRFVVAFLRGWFAIERRER